MRRTPFPGAFGGGNGEWSLAEDPQSSMDTGHDKVYKGLGV